MSLKNRLKRLEENQQEVEVVEYETITADRLHDELIEFCAVHYGISEEEARARLEPERPAADEPPRIIKKRDNEDGDMSEEELHARLAELINKMFGEYFEDVKKSKCDG